jgi:hypothetical protein
MSREPFVPSHHAAELVLTDDDGDGVVGGGTCTGPFDQGLYVHVSPRYNAAVAHPPAGLDR